MRLRSLTLAAAVVAACTPAQKPATTPTPAPGGPAGARPVGPAPQAPTTPPGAPAQAGAPQGGAPGGPGGAQPGEPNPRPYATVITGAAKSKAGLVTTHQLRGRLYFEIPAAELGKDQMVVISLRGTPDSIGIRGTLGGNQVVRWERKDNRVLLRAVNYRNRLTDDTGPGQAAMDIIQVSPILASFNVEAYGKDSAAVVDVTRLFTGGIPDLNPAGARTQVDANRSFIERVHTFATNVGVVASVTYTPQATPGAAPSPFGPAPQGATTQLFYFSVVRLPDVPMMGRFHDERVGYFRTGYTEYSTRAQKVERRAFINRWRLECSDRREGELCVPKKPITYYVDPATPAWLIPWVKKGIEDWQPAFREAGFAKGIVAAEAPKDNPEFSGEDASVAMVRWLPSPVENAVGPSTVDPRSGEILDADVQMYQNIMNLLSRRWYFAQVGHLDKRAQMLPYPDSLMGELVRYVVAHEVGHTLGFPHNFKASSMYPADSIRSKTWVAKMGHTPTLMDYARFNYAAQPEDGIALDDLIPKVGPYDKYAVMWGYKPIPGAKSPEDEQAQLDAWARLQDATPWFRFASDAGAGGADPGEQSEAVGDEDAVKATTWGLANLKRIITLVEPTATAGQRSGQDYSDLREMYGAVLGQWRLEMGHVTRVVGGVYKQEKTIGQSGAVYRPVEGRRQREAVRFLVANAFETPTWMLEPSILSKLEPEGSLNRIGAAQAGVLTNLLNNARLQRMVDIEAMGGSGYSLGQMLQDVRAGVWRETATGATIDPFRRRLQRAYLDAMASKLNPPATPAAASPFGLPGGGATAADARALVRGELLELDSQLAAAIGRTTDRTTRYHLVDARAQIKRILDPRS